MCIVTDMNHVGVTVPDIDAAIHWYVEVFGLQLLAGPLHCDLSTRGGDRRANVFGPRWGAMKLAHLVTGNGAGLELFQFLEPNVTTPEENFPYAQVGPHHLAFTVADFPGTLKAVLENEGRQRSQIFDVNDGEFICYCEDPWGNVIEIVSKSYDALAAATTVE
jgi:catechol 2,3-dioxygenase-like lactoylglutathione lyase family enzyme